MADAELTDLRKQCLTSLFLCTDNIGKYVNENIDKEEQYNILQKCVEEYCLLEGQQKVAIEALNKAKNETDPSNIHILEKKFTEHLNSLAKKKTNVNQHPFLMEYKKRVNKGSLSQENPNESDLAITESHDNYIDPITKKQIQDPVKNTVCGHIYEKEAILNLIHAKNRVRCPVVGCANRGPIQSSHLISDDELKFRLTITQHSTMIQERSIMDLDSSI